MPPAYDSDGTTVADRGLVCSVDRAATDAGVEVLRHGGSAADAAIATNAVLAVTAQHMCGLGGDLFALVHDGRPAPHALAAVGRAGSGADAEALRAEGWRAMPRRGDIRTVTVPGCVDGWLTLHERFGRLPLADLLAPARALATDGFRASPLLAAAAARIADVPGSDDYRRPGGLTAGDRVTRPLVAAVLDAVAEHGRDGFYRGRSAGVCEPSAPVCSPRTTWPNRSPGGFPRSPPTPGGTGSGPCPRPRRAT